MKGLIDQKILVTGASKGIGRAIAERLLREKAKVGLHYRTGDQGVKEIQKVHGLDKTTALKADLHNTDEIVNLFEQSLMQLGGLDSIVINAGIFEPHEIEEPLEQWITTWRRTMRINLEAAAVLTKLSIEHFKEQGQGRLIYIGSRAAFRGETEEYMAYAASKGGLSSLAKTVARSFGKYNIKSFLVAPGFIKTAMALEAIAKIGEEKVLQNISLKELTRPEDIAPVVALMCSGEMDHATGTTVDLNAGSHIR